MHRFIIAALAVLGLGLATPSAQAQTRWVMATPYPEGAFHTQNLRWFLSEIERLAPGKLVVQLHTNATLMPLNQIKRAVQTGQVQMGEVLLGAFGNEDPIYEIDFIPFLATTYPQQVVLHEVTGPAVRARLERQGITALYMVPWPSQLLYTRTELRTVEDLKGTRFRAQTPTISRMAELLGAMPTTVQAAEVPQAFATGIVNVLLTSAQTGVDTAAWDFSRYVTDIGFTLTRNVIMVNTRAFMALDEPTRAAIRDAAARAEVRGREAAAASEPVMMERLRAQGMIITPPSPVLMEGLRAVGAIQEREWLAKAGPDGAALLERYRAAMPR